MSYINYLSAVQIVEKNLIYTHKLYPQNIKYIKDAESNLGVKFPKSYIEFLLKYGILDIGSREIHGLDYTKDYSNYLYYNIICNTLDERKVNTDPPFPESFVVIYDLGDGEKFCLDTSKMNSEGECPVIAWYFGRIEPLYEDFGAFFLETVTAGLKSLEEDGNKVHW